MSDDSDLERHLQQSARERIAGVVIQGGRSRTLLLADLGSELGELRDNLNKRLQEAHLEVPGGGGRRGLGGRGSTHRTSFIEYVSEVYSAARTGGAASNAASATNAPTAASAAAAAGSNSGGEESRSAATVPVAAAAGLGGGRGGSSMMEALSIRGHSISSAGSGASAGGLSRDYSVRSEMGSNRVLGGGRHHPGARNKTSRVIGETCLLLCPSSFILKSLDSFHSKEILFSYL